MRAVAGLLVILSLASSAHALDGRRIRLAGQRLLDEKRREITLRGVNARAEGIFDDTFSDGRLPLEPVPRFDTGDAVRMRALGFNLLRLPINWSALEPTPGAYDQFYLDDVQAIVDLCGRNGILVILDFHQDAFSKEIGQDGAPRWVLDRLLGPGNYPYLGGPLTDLGARRFASWTLDAFRRFFDDQDGIQDAFARAAAVLARRFHYHPAVLGYELMNEPIADLNDDPDAALLAFHVRVTRAIRSVDRRHLILFEPDATRNFFNTATVPTAPFPDRRALYAPHVYTAVFDRLHFTGDPALLAPSMENAAVEAAAWGTPLLVGEWGIDPTHPFANEWITAELDLQDRLRAHSTFWVWEEISSGHWGLFDGESDVPGGERIARTTALSRIYARAVPGRVLEHAVDAAANTLHLRWRATVSQPIDLFVPPRRYPRGVVARCDGAPLATGAPDAVTGVLSIACGRPGAEHVLDVAPAP